MSWADYQAREDERRKTEVYWRLVSSDDDRDRGTPAVDRGLSDKRAHLAYAVDGPAEAPEMPAGVWDAGALSRQR